MQSGFGVIVQALGNFQIPLGRRNSLAGRRQVPVGILDLNDCCCDLLAHKFVGRAHVVFSDHNESLIWQGPTAVVHRLIDAYGETADDGGVIQQELLRGILPDTIQVVCKAGSPRKHLRITGGNRR